jgi:hypothetical protein
MGFNFPNTPTVGQLFPTPPIAGKPRYKWSGYAWTNVNQSGASPGEEGIPEAPIDSKQYARKDASWSQVFIPPVDVTKAYVDAADTSIRNDTAALGNTKVTKTGDSMSGTLTITTGGIRVNSGGIRTANNVAGVPTDLTNHLALFDTSYGLSVTGGTLNIVSSAAAVIQVTVNQAQVNGAMYATGQVSGAGVYSNGEVYAVQGGIGTYRFGTSNSYLHYDGSQFYFSGGNVNVPYPTAGGHASNANHVEDRAYAHATGQVANRVIRTGDTWTGKMTTMNSNGHIAWEQGGGGAMQIIGNSASSNHAFIEFHRPAAFACNFGLGDDNNFWMGGWSFGSGNWYRFWTTRDFGGNPAYGVTNMRMPHAGDFTHNVSIGLQEPYGGAAVTGNASYSDGGNVLRYRYIQVYTTDWWTIGYA